MRGDHGHLQPSCTAGQEQEEPRSPLAYRPRSAPSPAAWAPFSRCTSVDSGMASLLAHPSHPSKGRDGRLQVPGAKADLPGLRALQIPPVRHSCSKSPSQERCSQCPRKPIGTEPEEPEEVTGWGHGFPGNSTPPFQVLSSPEASPHRPPAISTVQESWVLNTEQKGSHWEPQVAGGALLTSHVSSAFSQKARGTHILQRSLLSLRHPP